jgi:hypothetical protein
MQLRRVLADKKRRMEDERKGVGGKKGGEMADGTYEKQQNSRNAPTIIAPSRTHRPYSDHGL